MRAAVSSSLIVTFRHHPMKDEARFNKF